MTETQQPHTYRLRLRPPSCRVIIYRGKEVYLNQFFAVFISSLWLAHFSGHNFLSLSGVFLQREINIFYPLKGRAEQTHWGPLDSLSNLICD